MGHQARFDAGQQRLGGGRELHQGQRGRHRKNAYGGMPPAGPSMGSTRTLRELSSTTIVAFPS
jgi:hypothetical protein